MKNPILAIDCDKIFGEGLSLCYEKGEVTLYASGNGVVLNNSDKVRMLSAKLKEMAMEMDKST